ncbi:uncharacterized protein [Anoplolepis gracilipes]|uniref:uncharacterized protein n=1 Tax=Anoplolepis gracilipes TaxID=354296 RepID=UPI003BA36EC7
MTREHLTPTIRDLPTSVIAGNGGYYGPINVDTHNMYEEIPCLGVLSEAVRQTVSNAPPGPYQSTLQTPGVVPNANLLGFKPLSIRRNEAKNLAYDVGITQDLYPEFPNNSGLNINLMYAISAYVTQTKNFKVTTLSIDSLPETGSTTQAIIQWPLPPTNVMLLEKQNDI